MEHIVIVCTGYQTDRNHYKSNPLQVRADTETEEWVSKTDLLDDWLDAVYENSGDEGVLIRTKDLAQSLRDAADQLEAAVREVES